MTMQEDPATTGYEILETARRQVLEEGRGLTQEQLVEVLRLPDVALPAALQLARRAFRFSCHVYRGTKTSKRAVPIPATARSNS